MLSRSAALDALRQVSGGGNASCAQQHDLAAGTIQISPLKVQPSPARKRSFQSRPPVEDDMSDDDDDVPLNSASFVSPARTPPRPVPDGGGISSLLPAPGGAASAPPVNQSVSSQIKDCRAKIKELIVQKEQRLGEQDYMGAHHIHQMVQEQEQKLRTLQQQLDAMPKVAKCAPRAAAAPLAKECSAPSAVKPVAVAAAGSGGADGLPAAEDDDSDNQSAAGDNAVEGSNGNDVDMGVDRGETIAEDGKPDDDESDDDDAEEAGQWCTRPSDPDHIELPLQQGDSGHPFKLHKSTFDNLYPYQRVGVAWMARLWQASHGGILADEMGLGKTVQVCAFLSGVRKQGATHALLLLPVTLLEQWAKEARRWCPGWPVYIYHGQAPQRTRALRRISRPQGGILLASYGVLSGSDNLFDVEVDDAPSPAGKRRGRKPGGGKRRKLDDDDAFEGDESGDEEMQCEPEMPPTALPSSGRSIPWDVVVCDEAHRMKGISTLLGKSVRKINAKCRLLLSGTPVQNALQDLWALLDFAQPGLLGNHATFVKSFSDPIDKGSVRGATPFAVQLKKHLAEQLRTLIGPHLLRRTKSAAGLVQNCEGEIASASGDDAEDANMEDGKATQLPPKRETILWLGPSDEQMMAYQKVLENSEVIQAACTKQKLGVEVFRAIGLLKRLCNHPMLVLPYQQQAWNEMLKSCIASAESVAAEGVVTQPNVAIADGAREESAAGSSSTEACDGADDAPTSMAQDEGDDDASAGRAVEMLLKKLPTSLKGILQQSAKLRCLATLLPALAERGHRTLIFSQSVKMLDLIWVCCLKPRNLRCLRLDGQTEVEARAEKVSKFQQQDGRFPFMLLTTQVGGVGLTLTAADRVILVDPAWNPAIDAQAVDRAYRIGQTKEVRVYRLIQSGLIEDKMFRLQVFKMGLTKTALEADKQHNYFTGREIRALFEWTEPSEGETRKLLEQEHGDDNAVQAAADDDGAQEGWFQAGPAVGMSDFAKLYSSVAKEEEPDDICAAQLMQAQQKLGAADEKMTRMIELRAQAESRAEEAAKELEEGIAELELLKEKRLKTEELLKSHRGELSQSRKAEAAALQRYDKAVRVRSDAHDQHLRTQQAHQNSLDDKGAEHLSASAIAAARTAEETFTRAMADVDAQFALVDEGGRAAGAGVADASVDKMRKAVKARDKLRATVDALTARQGELEAADDEVLKADKDLADAEAAVAKAIAVEAAGNADMQAAIARKTMELAAKGREKDRQRAEQAQTKMLQKIESAREAVSQAMLALIETGTEFADSFQAAQAKGKSVKAPQVKAAQVAVRGVLRALKPSWANARKLREASVKTFGPRRKAIQKTFAAAAEVLQAERLVEEAERGHAEASAEKDAKTAERVACDEAVAAAEAARAQSEREEMQAKLRRDELKASLPQVKEAIKAAKAAEKEAFNDRQQLHAACSKVERAASFVEEAKNSAIQNLQAEEYDAKQVDKAYVQAKKGKSES
eukprot:TRINITY_DN7314_c0_g1_i1.p1 TRINITY_DN7314_c0_g1~~TRINITY_DN7314_c0_g1_i1.p1  ORF type:complete len:1488 (-),score=354.37 TRINITY_DN7314_c0_g1_i1:293-4756(-)